jgi:DNA polymerase-4
MFSAPNISMQLQPPVRCMHLDMDTFFVSVERLLDPSLIGKPVIVGGTPFERGVVAGCSREARAYGVHSAMPLRRAWELCPKAVFLHPSHNYYSEYSERIAELLADRVPVLEKASVDEFYLDLSGCERIIGTEPEWGRLLKREVTGELGLPLTYGMARNKLVSKVATNVGKKIGDLYVPEGTEAGFLAPHPIRIMPGIGEVCEREMLSMGIHLIGDIARLSPQVLTRLYGKVGQTLHEHSRGIDNSPITPYHRRKSIGAEHTFNEDVLDPTRVLATLKYLSQKVAQQLREQVFMTKTVTFKLRYADFVTVTRTAHCDYSNADHTLYKLAERCFSDLYTRRVRVRLVGISASDLIEDCSQMALFSAEEEKTGNLYASLDEIRRRFGKSAIMYGSVLGMRKTE